MKKHTFFFTCCLALVFAAATLSAQGFIGPGTNPPLPFQSPQVLPPPPGPVPNPPQPPASQWPQSQVGFTGPAWTVTVEQARGFANKTPVVVRGTLVQALGRDFFVFRDSSGDIAMRIGRKEWSAFGMFVGPSENIEISGELRRDNKNWWRAPEIHARFIRRI